MSGADCHADTRIDFGYSRAMKRVLLTGMSGTGKSTLIDALAERGYKAVDLDTEEWSEWVPIAGKDQFAVPAVLGSALQTQDWVWREDRVKHLLSTGDAGVLFVSGTASNQGKFHGQFDHIVLLSAPASVLVERLAARTSNTYGKDPNELARVLQQVETVEPLLRRAASAEVDTSVPLDRVLEAVLKVVHT